MAENIIPKSNSYSSYSWISVIEILDLFLLFHRSLRLCSLFSNLLFSVLQIRKFLLICSQVFSDYFLPYFHYVIKLIQWLLKIFLILYVSAIKFPFGSVFCSFYLTAKNFYLSIYFKNVHFYFMEYSCNSHTKVFSNSNIWVISGLPSVDCLFLWKLFQSFLVIDVQVT